MGDSVTEMKEFSLVENQRFLSTIVVAIQYLSNESSVISYFEFINYPALVY